MSDFANLFQSRSYGLVLPTRAKAQIERYVAMHSGGSVSLERAPFRRQVDFWAFSIATALARDIEPLDDGPATRWGTVFIYTSQGIMDNELCSLLAVVAVAKMGHDDPDVGDPSRIVDLSNRLAGAGCPVVLKELSENALRTTPLDRAIELARSLQEHLRSDE